MVSSDHLLLELGLWSLVIVTQSDSLLIMVFAQGSVLGAYVLLPYIIIIIIIIIIISIGC